MSFKPDWGKYQTHKKKLTGIAPSAPPVVNSLAMQMDAADDRINFGDVLDLDGSTAFSMSFWINLDWASGSFLAFSKLRNGSPFNGWELGFNGSTGRPYLFMIGTITSDMLESNGDVAIADGAYSHVTMSYNGGKNAATSTKFYVDGVDSGVTPGANTFTGSSASPGLNFSFNARQTLVSGSPGPTIVKDVGFWTSELIQSDVDEIYGGGSVVDLKTITTTPQHLWRCGDTPGDNFTATTGIIQDSVGILHGTPINTVGGFVSIVP